ncbi:MAG TPA: GH25 family lysozyme [Chitinophagales bacterium]|nr:GH25 family lysozyme [Chitinophagales bacterium]HNL84741.1 GH25 family lysozyme [Chitinophagales bacterium]
MPEQKNKISLNDKIINLASNNIVLIIILYTSIHIASCGYIGLLKPDKSVYPLTGIDISHHQGIIEWSKAKNEISFVFVKATEGSDFADANFKDNIDSIVKYNIPYSAYHFFTFCSSGKNQAINFINHFKIDSNSLPPVIDLEFLGKCNTRNKDSFNVKNEIKDFLEAVQLHYKKIPIIYTTYEFYNRYLLNDFSTYHFWIRDLFKEPDLKDGKEFVFWQYSNSGNINGIKGNVDMNVFKGNIDKLISLSN